MACASSYAGLTVVGDLAHSKEQVVNVLLDLAQVDPHVLKLVAKVPKHLLHQVSLQLQRLILSHLLRGAVPGRLVWLRRGGGVGAFVNQLASITMAVELIMHDCCGGV